MWKNKKLEENAIKRIGKNLTKLGKLTIYYSFTMSNFNLCPLVWHFGGEVNTKKVENKNQERALRFIYEDYSITYKELLCKSKIPSLKIRKLRTIALEVFKIFNKECPVYLQDLITITKILLFFYVPKWSSNTSGKNNPLWFAVL